MRYKRKRTSARLRTVVHPQGYKFSDNMPWKQISRMDDVELQAMHAYLASLP